MSCCAITLVLETALFARDATYFILWVVEVGQIRLNFFEACNEWNKICPLNIFSNKTIIEYFLNKRTIHSKKFNTFKINQISFKENLGFSFYVVINYYKNIFKYIFRKYKMHFSMIRRARDCIFVQLDDPKNTESAK